jgi:hypothetical protein
MNRALALSAAFEPYPDRGGNGVQVEPEIVLPVQLEHLTLCIRPEHRLMLAVLEDAVRTYQTDCILNRRERALFCETAEWFASNDTTSPFCFVTICQLFGIDPDYVRSGLRRWNERHRDGRRDGERTVAFRIRHVRGSRTRITLPRVSRSPR